MNGEGNVQVGLAVNSSSLLFAIIVLSAFLGLAIIVSLMRIYKKAGKPAISAIIPIWNLISWLQIIEKPMWYIVLYLVPVINIVIMFQMYILLAKKFGKGAGFGVGMVFFPMIFIPLLSFSEYEGNVSKAEETVYNPFNEVQVEQVMPSAPIADVNVPAQPESVAIPTVEQSENNLSSPIMDAPVQPIVEPMEVSSVSTNSDVQDNQELSVNNIGTVSNTSEIKLSEEQTINPVIENNMGVEGNAQVAVADNLSNISNIPEVSITDGILPEQPAVVSFEDNGVGIQDNINKGVQDITNSINMNNEVQVKDIAFGSVPVVENPVTTIETIESVVPTIEGAVINNDVVEPLQNNKQVEEVIEMPEIATKTCPACGVSLAEDTKFCVSCGTQL